MHVGLGLNLSRLIIEAHYGIIKQVTVKNMEEQNSTIITYQDNRT